MTIDVSKYLQRVTSFHVPRPNYMAVVEQTLDPFVDAQNFLQALSSYFDIDTAIGVQLDIVGQWVGRSRYVPIPLQDMFFAFDDPLRGYDKGVWWNPTLNPGITLATLDDDAYRRLLKAKALANEWDGTIAGIAPILEQFFPASLGTNAFAHDDGWSVASGRRVQMGWTVGISGKIPSIIDLEILAQDLLPIQPAGVETTYLVTSVDGDAIFGFDVDNEYIGGFDHGSWGISPGSIAHSDIALLSS